MPLLPDIAKRQAITEQTFTSCPSIRGKHSNTFFSTAPNDVSVRIYNGNFLASDTTISQRPGIYKNSYSFDWNMPRIFFSASPQILEVGPAYLHKTPYTQFGHVPSGEFDIGKWFRPSSPTFQLWENETQFEIKEGEAHLYFNFPNKKRVVLQEFQMTERLQEIMWVCLGYKAEKPNQPLQAVYDMFVKLGLQKETLKEIQANLLSPKL